MFTGEGKTVTIAILAILLGLRDNVVDIASSSKVLAERDAKLLEGIYKNFKLHCSYIDDSVNLEEKKKKYQSEIIYSETSIYVGDILKQ